MFRTSIRETDSFLTRRMEVVLCMSNPRDSQLLADQLSSGDVTVTEIEVDDPLPTFDLCVVDTHCYPRLRDAIERRRSERGAVHLPVLLVLGPNDSEAAFRPHATDIDDVLAVPTSSGVFEQRVDALLRTKRQSEQLALFARAMDDATVGISIGEAGGDQELRYVNDAFLDITGYDREEALGRNCRFLQGPDTKREPVRELRRAIDEERPVAVELRNYRKDGTMFWNHLEIAPVYGEDGVSHFVGFQEDITERVEQTRSLSRYEEIVNAAGDPIYALDRDLRFTLVNGSTTALTTSTEADIIGSDVESVFGEDHAEVLEAAVLDLAGTGRDEMTIATVADDADGRQRRFQTTVAMLPTREFEGVACVSRDITEDRERESRLSVLDRVLRHNLRNKLMVMLAQVEAIQDRTDDEEVSESATRIERAGEELLDLAKTAREFKETVDPATDDSVGPLDIGSHTCHAVEETRYEYETATFVTDVPESLWATAHDSFELAMTELLEQAAAAGSTVEVAVEISEDPTAETAAICVSHDGGGLDQKALAALNSGIESNLQHTQGLGLWFVRWMAINSDGTFRISDNDPGTRVELTLPLAEAPTD